MFRPPEATVIIPTFGEARFSRWAIESVRRQTVKNIEIFIICDGSPPTMLEFFRDMAKKDKRIRVFWFSKSERTGEPYRDNIIKHSARGKYIFYCCHDDLWLPDHIKELAEFLGDFEFAHSLHAELFPGRKEAVGDDFFKGIIYADMEVPVYREKMLNEKIKENFFGLTCCAHTKKAYLKLKEGWSTTPEGIWTDLYMWRKFLSVYGERSGTLKRVTSLHFPAYERTNMSVQERDEELAFYYDKVLEPGFAQKVNEIARRIVPQLCSFAVH